MKDFIYNLLSETGTLSSKRFVGILAFFTLAASAIVDMSGGGTISEFIFYGLLALVAACFGMNTLLDMKSMSVKSNVASDIVQNEPESDSAKDAKDVLNSSKP